MRNYAKDVQLMKMMTIVTVIDKIFWNPFTRTGISLYIFICIYK